ncbi:MAG: hypothetical protein ACKOCN_04390 [Planctomycetaceae bacterium]
MHPLMIVAIVIVAGAAASTDVRSRSTAQSDSGETIGVRGQVEVRADGTDREDGDTATPNDEAAIVEKQVEAARKAAQQHAEATRDAIQRLMEQIHKGTGGQLPQARGVFGFRGSITIIGPDGVDRTQTFDRVGDGGDRFADLWQLVEKAIQAAGAEVPDDVRNMLNKAPPPPEPVRNSDNPRQALDVSEIAEKLDRILDRLEKIEADVKAIKATRPEAE